MSKVQLQGNVSGTGIFTIASPNSNTDRTLTLPDQTGTLLSSSAQGIPRSALPAGAVLQTVTGTSTTQIAISSSTFTAIGLSASITPTSSSSKILIMVSYPWNSDSSGTVRIMGGSRIMRDSTAIQTQTAGTLGTEFGNVSSTSFRWRYNNILIDSPASTSAITYSVQCNGEGTYNITYFNNGISGWIILQEIAA
jgi:hypothetical protein